ncbi:MAG: hypothetical protein KME16_16050 [Scytolyngbya sp. HA4215-MV1]|nr:hypothetical protein [Scytolyngbya sp. HA4215-MV1]
MAYQQILQGGEQKGRPEGLEHGRSLTLKLLTRRDSALSLDLMDLSVLPGKHEVVVANHSSTPIIILQTLRLKAIPTRYEKSSATIALYARQRTEATS